LAFAARRLLRGVISRFISKAAKIDITNLLFAVNSDKTEDKTVVELERKKI
jgi:hypothetical protein